MIFFHNYVCIFLDINAKFYYNSTCKISAPSQQPPPDYEAISPTSLLLTWSSPDYPNGVILRYTLYRDDVPLATKDPSGMCLLRCSW